jgi:hypothetical protein
MWGLLTSDVSVSDWTLSQVSDPAQPLGRKPRLRGEEKRT